MYPDIQLIVLEGRGCNRFLRMWAERFDHHLIMRVPDASDHIACARNRGFQWFRDECQLPWLVMMDDDIVPVPETQPLLESDAPVTAARVVGRAGRETHTVQDEFSMACVKIHRSVINDIPRPWFRFEYNDNVTVQISCECNYFGRKLAEHGITPVQAGIAGHRFAATFLPGEPEPRVLFDDHVEQLIKQTANA